MLFCIDCNHQLTNVKEKAVGAKSSDQYQMVAQSDLTGSWVCVMTGDEHRPGGTHDYVNHVQKVFPQVMEMFRNGDLTAEQALTVLAVDLGFEERDEARKNITTFVDSVQKGVDPEEALKLFGGE